MSTLNEKLNQFYLAQKDLYNHLGISRRLEGGEMSEVNGTLRANHGSGNVDIPTAYPQILDYRTKPWEKFTDHKNADDEIHVKIAPPIPMVEGNMIRFNTLSIWSGQEDGQAVTFVHAAHLPRPEEMEYAFPDEVARVEEGFNFYGDEVLLLLDPAQRLQ